jgi:GH24 family phage-related lysozyme (muramidase)
VLSLRQIQRLARTKSDGAAVATANKLSSAGVDFIKGWEGFRAKKYHDAAGHCTIGYGTLLHQGGCDGRAEEQPYNDGISEAKALELLTAKVAIFEKTIVDAKLELNQNQFDALVSFVYNVGSGAFQKSTLRQVLSKGNYDLVPTELKKWTKARRNGQVVDLPGLVKRRTAEAELFTKAMANGSTAQSRAMSAADYETDMQTIRDYVSAVVEAKNKLSTAYLAALDNFQTTVQFASATEAKPDYLSVILKSALKVAEKAVVTAAEQATGATLAPLVEMIHAFYDEIERAAKAAQSLAAGEWIKNARTAIVNAYSQDKTGEELRLRLESEYKSNDEGGRGGYIAGIQNELEAIGKVRAPKSEIIEVQFYTAWINQSFNNDCMDGTGTIWLQFADDGSLSSAVVNAPLGDKIGGALNDRMGAAGIGRLMDLQVVKKVCRSTVCMCFELNNTVRKATSDDAAQAFLSDKNTWDKARFFTA